jgi:hypothetical protein
VSLPDAQVQPPTAGWVLYDAFISNGVRCFSCVPGESFLPVLDGLYERGACTPGALA